MKKTLITLLAVAGVAGAGSPVVTSSEDNVTYTITTGLDNGAEVGTYGYFNFILKDDFFGGTAATTNVYASSSNENNEFLTSSVNLQSVGLALNTSDGNAPSALTLVISETTTGTVVGVSSGYSFVSDKANYDVFDNTKRYTRDYATFAFDSDVTLSIGNEYQAKFYSAYTETEKTAVSVALRCSSNISNTSGFWLQNNYQPGGVVLTAIGAIPEPTTATLSLLALVGLAARRRRK